MNLLRIFVISIAACIFQNCSCEIPPDVQKCRAGDTQCIAKTIVDILHKYPKGNKAFGLRNLKPFHLDELVLSRAQPDRQLNLNLTLKDLDIYGLADANVTSVAGFEKDPRNSKFQINFTVPLIRIRGQYEASGKILLLPVSGKGNIDVELMNLKSTVKSKVTTTNANGKLHLAISKIQTKNDVESMKVIRLDNPFNGNKALEDVLVDVINTNWRDAWIELEDDVNKGYAQIVNVIFGDVLKAIPYDEFYSDS